MTRTQIVKFRGPYDLDALDVDGAPDAYTAEVDDGYEETFALAEFDNDGSVRMVIAYLADIEQPVELKATQRSSGDVVAHSDGKALRVRLTYNLANEAAILDAPTELDGATIKFLIPDRRLSAKGHMVQSSATGLGF